MAFFWHLVLDNAGCLSPTIQAMSSVVLVAASLRSAYQLRNALQSDWDEVVLLANSECLEKHLREDLSPQLADPTLYTQDQRNLIGRVKLRQCTRIRRILQSREDDTAGIGILGVPGTAIPARVEPELWPEIIAVVVNS